MVSIIPYFAGVITILFSLGFYFALRDARETKIKTEAKQNRK